MGNTIVIGDVQTTTAGDTITNQIAAALAAEGLGSNAGKLKRVDTGAWEVARRSNGVITAIADAGGGKCLVTSAGHQQTDGTSLTIAGTTNYNATFTISDVTTDNFQITATYTSSQTGTFSADNIYYVPDAERNGDWPVGNRPLRRYYKGNTGATVTTIWGAFPHIFLKASGQLYDTAGNTSYPIQSYSASTTLALCRLESGNLVVRAGSEIDDANDTYFVTVDYYEL